VIICHSSCNRSYPVFSFLLSFLLFFAPPSLGSVASRPATALAQPAGSVEPCKIFGSVYLENDPRRANSCFAVVYVEPEQAFADVLVFNETNKLFADKAGLWCPAENREFADYTLFVTTDRSRADFAIHYTKVRSFAGCKQ
jgi:hypothetical protein